MKIRTGESHPFSEEEAQQDIFQVSPIPTLDYASRALRKAQDAYFAQWPEARKNARDYLWTITKN